MGYEIGDIASGIVSGVMDYGAFVRLESGETGMIHISKLSKSFVTDIRSVISKGDAVTATVISNNGGKLGLSLVGEDRKNSKTLPPRDFESMLSSYKNASEEKLGLLSKAGRSDAKNKRRRDR